MKTRILLTVLVVATVATTAFSQIKITGKVVDNKKAPLEFANVVLQAADTLFGTSAATDGSFELQAIPHNYTLKISMLGYKNYEKEMSLQSSGDLGEIRLEDLSTELKEVVVKGQRITRMPDRFVMNLANDKSIFGKNGKDILNTAPGVFILERDGSITVNGKSGTQVYVNERPLHETGTDLVRYLQNLKAEDIVKIEVLPNAGSEYDASVTGGIIKITLKNRRDDGYDGSVGVSYNFAPGDKYTSTFSPFYNMNYRINKLNLYAKLNYNIYRMVEYLDTKTITPSINMSEHTIFSDPQRSDRGSARIGGIYDLSDKQSVGLEVNYSGTEAKVKMPGNTTTVTNKNQTDIVSNYNTKLTIGNYSVSGNYLLRLDSLGSMFKILLDYFHNKTDNNNNYHAIYSGYMNVDSVYRSAIPTINNTYTVTLDWSHHFNNINTLNVGVKYARNEMDNSTLYEYLHGTDWNMIDALSNVNSFTENISALYGMFSSRIEKVGYSLGLRGEYTLASPYTNTTDVIVKQHYFKLFPSVNVMLPFGNNGKHSIVWNYHRTITRPSFMQLNPTRIAGSEYLAITGNPKLQPAIADDGSVALNLFSKYNLTAGITSTQNAFGTVRIPDSNSPGVIIQTTGNVSQKTVWYLSLNGPVNPTKWWLMNINMTGKRNTLNVLGEKLLNYNFMGYMNNTFSLPKDFKLDVSCWYQSTVIEGNMKTTQNPLVFVTLRKQFLKNKLTATVFVNNVFDRNKVVMKVSNNDFSQIMYDRSYFRQIGASLSYNFQAGKRVSGKQVETGAAEEKARMR